MQEEESPASRSPDLQQDRIRDAGSVVTGTGRHTIHCLTIVGQLEGHTVLSS